MALGNHRFGSDTRDMECAFEICIKNAVDVLRPVLQRRSRQSGSRIVDNDVERPTGQCRLDRARIGNIQRQGLGQTTCACDLFTNRRNPVQAPRGQGHFYTFAGQQTRKMRAKP